MRAETREVTLLPEEVVEQAGHSPPDAPLQVATAGCVLPKRAALEAGNKAVSRKQRGWGGEDAYFVAYGRWDPACRACHLQHSESGEALLR